MPETGDLRGRADPGLRSERILSLFLLMAGGRLHSAPELARRFGVSVRTLYRDLDTLSACGLPIEAVPGRDGGFRVVPGYALDRSVLGKAEIEAAAAALGSICEAVGDKAAESAERKLDALLGRRGDRRRAWIRISLAPGGDDRLVIDLLRSAIEERRLVRFRYRDAEGRETERRVEPAAVVYLWEGWYLWAWCRLRGDWRLFKLRRVSSAKSLLERFEPREEPSEDAWSAEWAGGGEEEVRIRVFPQALDRAGEYFGRDFGFPDSGGCRLLELRFPRNEWLFSFLLGFGDGIEVIHPPDLRSELAVRARRLAALYEKAPAPTNPDSP